MNYKLANCTCQNIPYMNYFDKNIQNLYYKTIGLTPDKIKTNKQALIYMIFRENYYKKIFNATDLAGKYNSENKRYYFNFYNFLDKSNTKLNSREIWLAKNQIFSIPKLKCNIEYQLYQQNLVNNIVNHNKYQELKCGEGYNFLSEKGFNDYLSKHIYYYNYPNLQTKNCENICDYRNTENPTKAFEDRVPIYQAFYQVYYEACFSSKIINKINQVKQSSLEAKVNNMVARFPANIFRNMIPGERKKLYSGKDILQIYNTVKQLQRSIK